MSTNFDSKPIHPILYESEYARVGLVQKTNVVLFQQTAKQVPTPELEGTWLDIDEAFGKVARGTHTLMLDVRKARGRNDAEFERAFAPHRARMVKGWRRAAIVVMSAPGVLQVQRYAREDNLALELRIFEDVDAAFLWLQEVG